jgi:hypothetical protein
LPVRAFQHKTGRLFYTIAKQQPMNYRLAAFILSIIIFSINCKAQNDTKPKNLAKGNETKVPKDAVKGDFNGDGVPDYAWLVPPKDSECSDCSGNCTSYIKFSDNTIPSIKIENCIDGAPTNLRDLNKNKTDEIGLLPGWCTSCWSAYYVYTLKNNKWIFAVDPFSTHCNQWEEGVKPIEIDLKKNGHVLIRYSALTEEDIVTKTKSVPIR